MCGGQRVGKGRQQAEVQGRRGTAGLCQATGTAKSKCEVLALMK